MSKKLRILIIAGVMAGIGVVLVVVTHKSAEKENGVMSRQEAERRVQELKEKIRAPIAAATQERIHKLTDDLGQDHQFVDVNGHEYAVSSMAHWELKKIGEPAVPYLIEAATARSNIAVRQHALGIIGEIYDKQDVKLIKCLPLFVHFMRDSDAGAVTQIGNIARRFYRCKREEELQQVIPYLQEALGDKNEVVQAFAGTVLYYVHKKHLIPEELIKKHGIGTESF